MKEVYYGNIRLKEIRDSSNIRWGHFSKNNATVGEVVTS